MANITLRPSDQYPKKPYFWQLGLNQKLMGHSFLLLDANFRISYGLRAAWNENPFLTAVSTWTILISVGNRGIWKHVTYYSVSEI